MENNCNLDNTRKIKYSQKYQSTLYLGHGTTRTTIWDITYWLSKKSCPFSQKAALYKHGPDFLDSTYSTCRARRLTLVLFSCFHGYICILLLYIPISLDPLYIKSYIIKWGKTSRTYSINNRCLQFSQLHFAIPSTYFHCTKST